MTTPGCRAAARSPRWRWAAARLFSALTDRDAGACRSCRRSSHWALHRRGLAARRRTPCRAATRRLLGLHRREAPLHPVRHAIPYEEHWRPALAVVLLLALWIARARSARFWRPRLAAAVARRARRSSALLMWGGVFGLPYVENERWGGLPLTLILGTYRPGVRVSARRILLALGRRSQLPAIRALCVAYIELMRGVPLITRAVHGLGDAAAVPAGGHDDRQAAARAGRVHPVRRRLSRRGGARRPAGDPEGPVRGRRRARPRPTGRRTGSIDPAAGAAHRRSRRWSTPSSASSRTPRWSLIIGLFDLLSTVKVALTRAGVAAASAWRPTLRGADLLRLLLRHVALQPALRARAAGKRRDATRAGLTEKPL